MDKNLKADLVALRNEVLSNLKNIEQVVGKIDSKLQEEETTSCLSRCPEISTLINQCRAIKLHPDTDMMMYHNFYKTVDAVHERMSALDADRYVGFMTEVMKLANKMDQKMGTMPERAAIEEYWNQISPGTSDRAVEYLYALKTKEGHIKPPSPVDADEINDVLGKMQKRLDQPDTLHEDDPIDLAPSWAKNTDTKSIYQIFAEAAEWDEDSHALFGRMWNGTALRRIELMEQAMQETVEQVQGYNYYNERVSIKCEDDFRKLATKYNDLEHAKRVVVDTLLTFDRTTISGLKENVGLTEKGNGDQAHPENWAIYYDWHSRLEATLEAIGTDIPQGYEVASGALNLLKVITKEKELELVSPSAVIDPITLEPRSIPAEKLDRIRKKARNDYMRDLKNAYAWRKQRLENAVEPA